VLLKILSRQLADLRDRLQARGQRPSMLSPHGNLDVVEAMAVVQEYGDMCEAMLLRKLVAGLDLGEERAREILEELPQGT
jgi:hypothetical protein